MKALYTHKTYTVHRDGDTDYILKRWRDNTGEKQYDLSIMPDTPKPALPDGSIVIYSNMVKLNIGELQPKHLIGKRRGSIIPEFIGKKRKRMLDAVNSWRIPMINVMFVTLTYPKNYPQDWKVWKNDLKIYKEHLQRKFPQVQGFWKLELQKRGAPHYHLVFDCNEKISLKEFREWNDQLWANIAHYMDPHAGAYACTVKAMLTAREALNYAAKYQTKATFAPVDENGELLTAQQLGDSVGRLWGRIGKPDCSPSEAIPVRREWALNNKAVFARLLAQNGQERYAEYLERQGAHNSLTLYGMGDNPQADTYRNAPKPPSFAAQIHPILSRDRAYSLYKPPKRYKLLKN